MLCSHFKPFKFMAGPRSSTSAVTAQLISRRWEIISFWCYVEYQQRSNQRLVVLPQTPSSSFHGVKQSSRLDGMKLFKNIQIYGWAVLPKHGPVPFKVLKNYFRPEVMQPVKNIQVYGWAALPNVPCHSPVHCAALSNFFVVKFCSLSTTFKSTAGRAPPNTTQLISRCQTIFSFRWYETLQKHSNLWLGCAPRNITQFLSRCWRTVLCGCYAHV